MSEEKHYYLGRYQIQAKIGIGAMAAVFRAWDPLFNRFVAIKLLHPQFLRDSSVRQRFLREAQTVAKLEHPCIVPMYDYGEQDRHVYLVMRLMEGGTLEERLTRETLSQEAIIDVLQRVGSALDHAHRHGMVHRDIKPGNILYDGEGQPFLADFGIVKLDQSQDNLTADNLVGTPAYMSPEQVNPTSANPVDKRSDLYALGILLFEMLTGKLPYEGDTSIKTSMLHITAPVPKIETLNPRLKNWQSVLDKTLAKKADKRYQSAELLMQDVSQLLNLNKVGRKRSRGVWLWGGITSALFLSAMILFFILKSNGSNDKVGSSAQETVSAQGTMIAVTAEYLEMVIVNNDCRSKDKYQVVVDSFALVPTQPVIQLKGEPIQSFKATWKIENKTGCPLIGVIVRSRNSNRPMTIPNIDTGGIAGGNFLAGNSKGTISVVLNDWVGDDLSALNNLDEQFDLIVKNGQGNDVMLDLERSMVLNSPSDWVSIVEAPPTDAPVVVSTKKKATATSRKTSTPVATKKTTATSVATATATVAAATQEQKRPTATATRLPVATNTLIPAVIDTPVSVLPTATDLPTQIPAKATDTPRVVPTNTRIRPTATFTPRVNSTNTPTQVWPTTAPTRVPPTATPRPTTAPTRIPPTLTPLPRPTTPPTRIPPTSTPLPRPTTDPTRVPPTSTPLPRPTTPPTRIPPTSTPLPRPTTAPTRVPPTSTPLPRPTTPPTRIPPTSTPLPRPTIAPTRIPPTATPVLIPTNTPTPFRFKITPKIPTSTPILLPTDTITPLPVATDTPLPDLPPTAAAALQLDFMIISCGYANPPSIDWVCQLSLNASGGVPPYIIYVSDRSSEYPTAGSPISHQISSRRCKPWVHNIEVVDAQGTVVKKDIYLDPNQGDIANKLGGQCVKEVKKQSITQCFVVAYELWLKGII